MLHNENYVTGSCTVLLIKGFLLWFWNPLGLYTVWQSCMPLKLQKETLNQWVICHCKWFHSNCESGHYPGGFQPESYNNRAGRNPRVPTLDEIHSYILLTDGHPICLIPWQWKRICYLPRYPTPLPNSFYNQEVLSNIQLKFPFL